VIRNTSEPLPWSAQAAVQRNREAFARAAEYYDDQFATRTEDVDFWLARASELPGRLLEVGCGTGRILVPLAAAGHQVAGIDHSAEMLARAASASRDMDLTITLHHADLRTPPTDVGRFRQIFFTFGVFQYLLDSHADVLARYRSMLEPDGRIFVDVKAFLEDPKYIAALDREREIPPEQFARGGRQVRVTASIHWDTWHQTITERYRHQVHDGDGAVVEEYTTEHVMRSYSIPELLQLASAVGLRVIRSWRSYRSEGAVTGPRYLLELAS
jgi:SAM-dependent methyltransferase